MPDWASVLLNYGPLGIFMAYVLWGTTKGVQAYWPVHKERMAAQRKKIEADEALANSLKMTTENQTNLMERQTGMLHDHGQKLQVHGTVLERQAEILAQIRQDIKDGVCRHPRQL